MKQAASKKWDASAPPDTPYRKAQQAWDDRDGSARKQAHSWRLAAFFCMGLVLLSIIGMLYLGTLPKTVVEYVEVDSQGHATYVGRVGQIGDSYQLTHEQVEFHLREFVDDSRSLSSDPLVIRKNWFDAYRFLAGEATKKLSAYAQANDPFARAKDERVVVTIESVLPIAPETYQADWAEEIWSKQGSLKEKQKWRGTFTVARIIPDTSKELAKNPLGVYIVAFSWARI
ncbi:MAG: type IV secretion system protein [Gammaproteobacteria bacterium]|nr:type IV secretion system protein [Gammaproteobacteria bacterium]MCP4386997.1 type IV secretion system protein [Gammaproteobacteria bacterium]MCP5093586.1 type IV secretion system protein [Gammaproteobacteria bacterium]